MRRFKLNCAEVTPSQFEKGVDDEFLSDVGSIITLEDGSSLDLNKAVLLYDPKTKKIQLSDAEVFPENFKQLATLNITNVKPDLSEDIVDDFTEPTDDEIADMEPEAEPEDSGGESIDAGDTGDEDVEQPPQKPSNKRPSADFFQ